MYVVHVALPFSMFLSPFVFGSENKGGKYKIYTLKKLEADGGG